MNRRFTHSFYLRVNMVVIFVALWSVVTQTEQIELSSRGLLARKQLNS